MQMIALHSLTSRIAFHHDLEPINNQVDLQLSQAWSDLFHLSIRGVSKLYDTPDTEVK